MSLRVICVIYMHYIAQNNNSPRDDHLGRNSEIRAMAKEQISTLRSLENEPRATRRIAKLSFQDFLSIDLLLTVEKKNKESGH